MMLDLKDKHRKMLYPEVRVRSGKALGSGTILYSAPVPEDDGRHETYVLTNEHVVDDLIEIKDQWDSVLRREVKRDILGTPVIETFEYDYWSRVIGGTTYEASIVAYDKREDLALLKVRTPRAFEHVATMYPRDKVESLTAFMSVVTVGCGMGNKPVITFGYISGFGYEIDGRDFIQASAASYMGNSGGATFLEETGQFVGVPARITVAQFGFSADVVSHIGFIIPVWRAYQFLEDQVFQFVYDSEYTSLQCKELRAEKRDQDQQRILREEER